MEDVPGFKFVDESLNSQIKRRSSSSKRDSIMS